MTENFTPIAGSASEWGTPDGVRRLNHENEREITDLLMGRKVVKVDAEHLLLDDGTTIKAIGHDGGCACSAGCYDLSVLNGVDNIITRVEFDYAPAGDGEYPTHGKHRDDPDDKWTGYYRIFVFADNEQINLMQFDGSDGNGYYGTGYEILVRRGVRMTTELRTQLAALEGPALRTFVNMLAPHFAHHDAIDRDTLVRYAAEAEATS